MPADQEEMLLKDLVDGFMRNIWEENLYEKRG